MGKAIPAQHPAVVLRSHYNHMRALLAVAMIAVACLTAAVVILANNDDRDTSAGSATQVSAPGSAASGRYHGGLEEGTADVSQAQPRVTQSQALPGLASQALEATQAPAQGTRYDGGP